MSGNSFLSCMDFNAFLYSRIDEDNGDCVGEEGVDQFPTHQNDCSDGNQLPIPTSREVDKVSFTVASKPLHR